MRLINAEEPTDHVTLVLTKEELELLEEEARGLRLSETETHCHVNDDDYKREILLVLADPRTRGGFNDEFNALVEEILQ